MRDDFSREMFRQRLALRTRLCSLWPATRVHGGLGLGMGRLLLFQLELQLLKLEDDLLTLAAEDHVPQLLDHELQMLDPFAA